MEAFSRLLFELGAKAVALHVTSQARIHEDDARPDDEEDETEDNRDGSPSRFRTHSGLSAEEPIRRRILKGVSVIESSRAIPIMAAMRVLLIEDKKKTAGFLAKGLREDDLDVEIAYDG